MPHKVFLILGCNGRVDGKFVSCGGIENKILELSPKMEKIDDIIAYFKAMGLFAAPVKDYNASRRILFYINDKFYQNLKPLWDEKFFRLLEKFTLAHKDCGIYLKLGKE